MLATTAPSLPRDGGWAAEIKWDGWRVLSYLGRGGLRVRSRRGTELAARLPELASAATAVAGHQVIVDGELVALTPAGRPSFELLQGLMQRSPRTRPAASLVVVLFDLLWQDGSLLALPYTARRARLEAIADRLPRPSWQLGPADRDLDAMLTAAVDLDLEGVIVKRLASPYRPGSRSADWCKVFATRTSVMVVGGVILDPVGQLDALVVGVPHPAAGGLLRYTAHLDHGLTDTAKHQLTGLLLARRTEHSPFLGRVPMATWNRPPRPIIYVRPEVGVRVAHRGQEPSGRLRHPRYAGGA